MGFTLLRGRKTINLHCHMKYTMANNSLEIHNNTLYFTNAPLGTFVSVPLNANGTAAGPPTTHLQDLEVDDFTIDANGHAYMSVFYSAQIARYLIGDQNATMIAGPSKMLSGPRACKF